MKIKVFNELAIQKFVTDEKHIVISLQDPNYDFVKLPDQKSRVGYLGINCYDLDEDTGVFPYGRFLFERHHAKAILKLVNTYADKVNLICVNCAAGVSRSAGVAGALSKILNGDDMYYFKHYCPNMRIYRFILQEHYGNNFNDFNKRQPPTDDLDINNIF